MSVVTTVIVCYDVAEPEETEIALATALDGLDAEWFRGTGMGFVWRDYNHLDLGLLWKRLGAISWHYPDNVQVLAREETDARFQVWMYRGGTLRQLVHGNPDDEHGVIANPSY